MNPVTLYILFRFHIKVASWIPLFGGVVALTYMRSVHLIEIENLAGFLQNVVREKVIG